ncbi:MAG: hypothetical protein CMO55_08495 [Verrucomicrobiales bacterium]|nr:hypothetical protein [Verrucomicrobiales bacterium]
MKLLKFATLFLFCFIKVTALSDPLSETADISKGEFESKLGIVRFSVNQSSENLRDLVIDINVTKENIIEDSIICRLVFDDRSEFFLRTKKIKRDQDVIERVFFASSAQLASESVVRIEYIHESGQQMWILIPLRKLYE